MAKIISPKVEFGSLMAEEPKENVVGTGEEAAVERFVSNYLGTGIHLFLCAMAIAGLIVLRFYYLPGKAI